MINPSQNVKYEGSELSDMSEYKENDENQILLDSFDASELEDADKDKIGWQGRVSMIMGVRCLQNEKRTRGWRTGEMETDCLGLRKK